MNRLKLKNLAALIILCALVFLFLRNRFHIIGDEATQSKGDLDTYKEAIETFISGGNPYTKTVESFASLESNPGGKGFAYPPFLLFLYAPLHSVHLYLQANYENYHFTERFYFDIVGFVADVGTGVLIYVIMRGLKVGRFPALFSLFVWFFNPYIYKSNDYYPNDLIVVFLTTLAVYFSGIKKDQVLSGFFIGLASTTKTYPLFLFPIMLYLSTPDTVKINSLNSLVKYIYTKLKGSKYFLISFALPPILLSLPFMTDLDNFLTYIHGSLLVQSERFVQGRPFLYYISYFYKVEFLRMVPFNVYTTLAVISGLIISSILILLSNIGIKRPVFVSVQKYLKKLCNIFSISAIIMTAFYIFTPVLNRTYLIWFIPSLCIASFDLFRHRKVVFGYLTVAAFWLFYYFYLLPWKDGFHIWHP